MPALESIGRTVLERPSEQVYLHSTSATDGTFLYATGDFCHRVVSAKARDLFKILKTDPYCNYIIHVNK